MATNFFNIDTNDCPFYLITRASLSISSEMKKALSAAGVGSVKPAYLSVLLCLWRDDSCQEMLSKLGTSGAGLKLSELGSCAGLEPSTMTGVIDRMERDGLVVREDHPEDRRVQMVRLTDRGVNIRKAVTIAVNDTLNDLFEGIDMKSLETAKKVLRQILINTNRGELQ